jgi:hypothetical protein
MVLHPIEIARSGMYEYAHALPMDIVSVASIATEELVDSLEPIRIFLGPIQVLKQHVPEVGEVIKTILLDLLTI